MAQPTKRGLRSKVCLGSLLETAVADVLLQKLLGCISLCPATEAIIFSLLINKVSGLYGILALFTGYHLNAFQLSMYIYSILVFGLGIHLARHIRSGTVLPMLALTWIYIFDSLLNAAYTTLFGIGWFKMLASNISKQGSMDTTKGTASLIDTAHLAKGDKSKGRVIAAVPTAGSSAGHDPLSPTHPVDPDALSQAFLASGSFASITVICLLYLLRMLAWYVLIAYTRECLQRSSTIVTSTATPSSAAVKYAATVGVSNGDATKSGVWRRKLGRVLTAFPSRGFWLAGRAEDDTWLMEAGEKFRNVERRGEMR